MTVHDFSEHLKNTKEHELPEPEPLIRKETEPTRLNISVLGPLQDITLAVAEMAAVPPEMSALSALASASLATQALNDIQLPWGQNKPLSLSTAVIGKTGSHKSAVDKFVTSGVRAFEEELSGHYEDELGEYINAKEVYDLQRKDALKDKDADAEELKRRLNDLIGPLEPMLPIVLCEEPTIEGLIKVMDKSHPSMGIFTDEGAQFIGGHGMMKDALLRTAGYLSRFWDGSPVKRVRASEVIILKGRRLSVSLMVQPEIVEDLTGNQALITQGLLSRFLVCQPPSLIGERLYDFDEPENERKEREARCQCVIRQHHDRTLDLMREPLPLKENTRNELAPPALVLSPDARNDFFLYHNDIERNFRVGEDYHDVQEYINKMPEVALRIAGILHVYEGRFMSPISRDYLCIGIEITRYCINEALRLMKVAPISAELRMAIECERALLTKWNEPNGYVALQDLYQSRVLSCIRDKRTAQRIVNILQEHKRLIPVTIPAKGVDMQVPDKDGRMVTKRRRQDIWKVNR